MKNPCIDCKNYHPFCCCSEFQKYQDEIINKVHNNKK